MRKFLYLFATLMLCGCVGQKDDPDDMEQDTPAPVVPAVTETGSRFFRRALVLEFTATWCQYCPNMAEALEEAKRERPDRFVDVAVHYADELAATESDAIVDVLKVSAYPTVFFDWDEGTRFTRQEPELMTAYIDGLIAAQEEACGISVCSEIKDGELQVSVSMIAVTEGTYSLVAALVEDDIRVTQSGAGANYVCNAVLRSFLDPGRVGKPTGMLKADESYTATFWAKAPEEGEKMRVVAYVLCDGLARNVATCKLDGQSEYAYEKDD